MAPLGSAKTHREKPGVGESAMSRAGSLPPDLERLTLEIGADLLRHGRAHHAGFFSSRFWSDRLMGWAMRDAAFKVQLFRFVDLFPTLKTDKEVYECLVEYLGQPGVRLPGWMGFGLKAGGLAKGALAAAVTGRIKSMAGSFIAGADAAAALPKLKELWDQGIAFSVDLLGEACLSNEEAQNYQKRYLDLIGTLSEDVRRWKANPTLDRDHLGPIPRTNVSIKISSLFARTDAADFEGTIRGLLDAIRPLLQAARQRDVLVNFDMEQHAVKDLTLELFERCCQEHEFPAGLALQAYLRSGEEDARRIIAWAKRTGRVATVRLIKGAYWDYEVIHAERMGWPAPVWTDKRQTDACFERMAELLVAAMPQRAGEGGVKLAVGSHNVRSIARTLALLRTHDLPESALEVQMLYGMADQLKSAILRGGLRLREYVPIGEMLPGMAYLVRRLLENTSNQSWLRAGFFDHATDEELLASPHTVVAAHHATLPEIGAMPERHQLSPAVEGLGDGRPFFNEPLRDFSQTDQREQFAEATRRARVPERTSPLTPEQLEEAVRRAEAALPSWRDVDPLARSATLVKAAAEMRGRRDELAGIMIREAGKTWREADADVCEAIDFCEYYARSAAHLFRLRRLGAFVGELNEIGYQPRGVAAVISPWNFPLSISTGMTAAALVTGNVAMLKPSEQTPGIARVMCDIFWRAGVPAGALQFVAGRGEIVGASLVRDPRVALIAFTGSKEVGLDILRAAGQTPPGQGFVKKVVCEMGGKNAIIVDDSADLDDAVLGVRQSAFGYSGQKCSACSRAIVTGGVYDAFLRRLLDSTRSLMIGDPMEPGTDIGPVIDGSAERKIHEYIEVGKSEGRLELACEVPAGLEQRVGKPYVGPHIFSGILPQHRLAQEEIFGPVLSVMRAADFREALQWANSVTYKLTGGVFSRKPSHLELARREFRVGNLYLNRGITGAQVGRQPFGGFGLSGTGTQAGGPDYLLHFVEPRSYCENTMRHGFAPTKE